MPQSIAAPRWMTIWALLGAPLLVPAALVLAPGSAHAQSPGSVFDASTVALLPGTPAVGDGVTPVVVRFLALDPSGAPIAGISGRVRASSGISGGEFGRIEPAGVPGLYQATWTPPKRSAPDTIAVSFQGRTVDRQLIQGTFQVPLLPPIQRRIAVSASPSQVVLGQDARPAPAVQRRACGGVAARRRHRRVGREQLQHRVGVGGAMGGVIEGVGVAVGRGRGLRCRTGRGRP